MENIYKCPKCGEDKNLLYNYDYSQQHRPVKDVLCTKCEETFDGNILISELIKVSQYPELEATMNMCEDIIQKRTGKMTEEEWQAAERAQTATKQETLDENNKWSLEKAEEFALERFKSDYKKGTVTLDLILKVLKVGVLTGHKFGAKWNEPIEMSDEEIMKGAKEWYNKEGAYSASAIALKTWVYAIRWYCEQLKKPKNEIND